jgi:nicotinamide mononucleotide transporter
LFKGWTKFEIIWLSFFTVINIYLFFAWDDTLVGLISSLSGMLCVVLVAKGKIGNYYFGIIQTILYAYISYTYSLYGEAMLNAIFYLPLQFIGIYLWKKNKAQKSAVGEEVAVKKLTKKGWIVVITISVIASLLYAELLFFIGSQQVRIDSVAVVLSIVAQLLMLFRYAEQWVMWIVVNVLSVLLWVITLTTTGGNDYTVLVMWLAFLVNSIYGYVNWLRMSKGQGENRYE